MATCAKNLTGREFGWLTVVRKEGGRSDHGGVLWVVHCRCGEEIVRETTELLRPSKNPQHPRSCGCNARSSRIYTSKYGGVGDLSGRHFGVLQRQAEHRGHEFSVTIEYLWEMFQRQEGRCALTGVSLSLSRKNMREGETMASLDRIKSEIGYLPENVQWVHPTVNFMKHAMPLDRFIEWCCLVADHVREKD